jgi:hypothetical protein
VRIIIIILAALIYMPYPAHANDERMSCGKAKSKGAAASLNGTWYSAAGTATFNADGTLISNGQRYLYSVKEGVILLTGADVAVAVPYKLSKGKLTVTVNGEPTVYTRKPVQTGGNTGSGNSQAGGISNDLLLSSAWCSFSYNAKTGYSSSSRVQLRPDGTYSTGGQNEGYSSGFGGTYASQNNSSGGGRWKIVKGQLYMSEGNGNLAPVQTSIKRNSNGNVFLVTNGVEYSQCK